MKRRQFLNAVTTSLLLSRGLKPIPDTDGTTDLRFVAPDFSDHAKNSISFFEEKALDRNNGALRPYFRITFHRKPGFFSHANWDWSENLGRWLYGSLFARVS